MRTGYMNLIVCALLISVLNTLQTQAANLPNSSKEIRGYKFGITQGMVNAAHKSDAHPCFQARQLSYGPTSTNALYGGISAGYYPEPDESFFSSIFFRLTYSDFTSNFRRVVGATTDNIVDPFTGNEQEWRYSEVSEMSIRLAMVSMEFMTYYDLFDSPFNIGAGITFDFPTYYDKIRAFGYEGNVPDKKLYSNHPGFKRGMFEIIDGGKKIRYTSEFENKYVKSGLLGFKAGLSYIFSIKNIDIIPSINVNYLASTVTRYEPWRIHRIQFGLDTVYAF